MRIGHPDSGDDSRGGTVVSTTFGNNNGWNKFICNRRWNSAISHVTSGSDRWNGAINLITSSSDRWNGTISLITSRRNGLRNIILSNHNTLTSIATRGAFAKSSHGNIRNSFVLPI
ncbi:hypothetical protein L873DRAFT_352120 [Choiromyces venosus 120613-1]|uniref:Uncharacterized protein n=1 Tax=Choiromyces venosus 120613-1 TaxID=1336337 RepID=A0A3N4J1F7_9PEZI|nr:hypothetical protein L873DRAFT_352120 [Choiromyces venosus 120613-1]